IAVLVESRSQSDKPDSFNGRLKSPVNRLALLDGRDSAQLVIEVLALPGEWDEWSRAEGVEGLLRSGARLDAEATPRLLNSALDTVASKQILLSFVDPDMPQTGVEPHLEYYHRQRLAAGIVDVARSDAGVKERLYSLCKRELPPGMRLLLADVVAKLGTGEPL